MKRDTPILPGATVGVLGSGQLGRMFAIAARQGRGRVFTFTMVHHAAFPALAAELPYNVSAVVLDDVPGVRLVTNVVSVARDALRIDLPVTLAWDEPQPGVVLPRFRPAT